MIRFFATQRLGRFRIGEEPYLDTESIGVFKSALRDCRFYLEYGSGGGTVLAARLRKHFISVETDRHYLKSVRKKIGALSSNQRLVHANVGLTGPWGTPFWRRANPQRLRRWSSALEAPWQFIARGDSPDLVLVDGRFRVASTLICCLHLADSPTARILVDDYATYPNYHAIERYATLTRVVGRMAIFQPAPSASVPTLRAVIAEYSAD